MKQHSQRFLDLVSESKSRVKEITPHDLNTKREHHEPLVLIDIREDHEITSGAIHGSMHLGKGIIERDIEKEIPDIHTPIVVYCSGGYRGVLVADTLQKMGYTEVSSLMGGLKGWQDAGFHLEK